MENLQFHSCTGHYRLILSLVTFLNLALVYTATSPLKLTQFLEKAQKSTLSHVADLQFQSLPQ